MSTDGALPQQIQPLKPISPLKAKLILRDRARQELAGMGLSGRRLRKAARVLADKTYLREVSQGRRFGQR